MDRSNELKILFIANVGMAICLNMVGSLQSLYLMDLGATMIDVGYVYSLTSGVSLIFMLLSGLIVGEVRPGIIIGLSFIFLSISGILLAHANNWRETIPFFILNSSAYAIFIPVRMLVIASLSKPSKIGITYGLMNISWPIGGLLGPIVGGKIAERWGWHMLFYAMSFIAIMLVLPSLTLKGNVPNYRKTKNRALPLRGIAMNTVIFLVAYGLLSTARGMIDPILPIYLKERFSMSKSEIGLFSSFGLGLATMIIQIPSGILGDRMGYKRTLLLFASLIPIIAFSWPFVTNIVMLGIMYMFLIGAWSATWSPSASYLVKMTEEDELNIAMTLRQICIRAGFIIGPMISSYAWTKLGLSDTFEIVALLALIAFLISLLLKGDKGSS